MDYLVDIGNSRTKYVTSFEGKLSSITCIDNEKLNRHWFNNHWSKAKKILVATVSLKNSSNEIVLWAGEKNIPVCILNSEKTRFGVTSAYAQANKLGVDRWLALLGTAKLFPNKNVLIVDAGTATTIDLISSSGLHIGGWILPGIKTMFDSVQLSTTLVQAKNNTFPSLSFAQNTSDNVNNACWAATIGAIELAAKKAKVQLQHLDAVIVTGGNGAQLLELLTVEAIQVENLIFHGIQRYSTE